MDRLIGAALVGVMLVSIGLGIQTLKNINDGRIQKVVNQLVK